MYEAILNLLKTVKKNKHRKFIYFTTLGLVLFIISVSILFYNINFDQKIYSNIYMGSVYVGQISDLEFLNRLKEQEGFADKEITVRSGVYSYTFKYSDIDVSYLNEESLTRAYFYTRTGNFITDIGTQIKLLFYPKQLGFALTLSESKLETIINDVEKAVSIIPKEPKISILDGKVQIENGTEGILLDKKMLRANIGYLVSLKESSSIEAPLYKKDLKLTDNKLKDLTSDAQKYLGKKIELKFESKTFSIPDTSLVTLLDTEDGFNIKNIALEIRKITDQINREPQNPKFEINGTRVVEFAQEIDGINVDTQKLLFQITSALDVIKASDDAVVSIEIPYTIIEPDFKTADINNFGIKEIIGKGVSTYYHSIPGRVFNVNLAAEKINGTLVPPGETFSFNKVLGDVSKLTGFKEAYVIKDGRTVLDDGGGVCQVSTTLFRAALNAGLKINERAAHAYRVGYYEQNSPPGIDATVYYPTTDFKFTNNTDGYILINTKNDPKKYALEIQIFGAKDGRIVELSKPVITNYKPPLEPVYEDDPTLQIGQTKQVDYAAAGARISFNYKVTKNGENIISKTFVSNYQPWASRFLRGTKI